MKLKAINIDGEVHFYPDWITPHIEPKHSIAHLGFVELRVVDYMMKEPDYQKPKVKKWRWVITGYSGVMWITEHAYGEREIERIDAPTKERIDSTMIEE